MRQEPKEYLRKRRLFYKQNGRCTSCGTGIVEVPYTTCRRCLDRHKQYDPARTQRFRDLRKQVLLHYGNKCSCCGETEPYFLAIDHINNDGAKRRIFGNKFYTWIVKNNYPQDLQLLCHNCNYGKYRNGGICPHETAFRKVVGL